MVRNNVVDTTRLFQAVPATNEEGDDGDDTAAVGAGDYLDGDYQGQDDHLETQTANGNNKNYNNVDENRQMNLHFSQTASTYKPTFFQDDDRANLIDNQQRRNQTKPITSSASSSCYISQDPSAGANKPTSSSSSSSSSAIGRKQLSDNDNNNNNFTAIRRSSSNNHNKCGISSDGGGSSTTTTKSSLALENLIDQFDGKSILSKSASILTFFYSFAKSNQSNTRDHSNQKDRCDTLDNLSGSYYSALPDAFSLNDFNERGDEFINMANNNNNNNNSSDFAKDDHANAEHLYLWQTCDKAGKNNKLENKLGMTTKSDFQVFWNDISYQIKPKLNLNYISQQIKSSCDPRSLRKLVQSKYSEKNDQHVVYPSKPVVGPQNITILNHINGSFRSGELTALMGPSGAGKTSLLNFLARRREKGYSGWLTIAGRSKKIKISMIPQHDSLPGNLTVRENLTYASRLKNAHIDSEHKKNIETIARLLGIDGCLETQTKKISGGEQKRLSIGQELVSKPDVLILDEPTSGLDSLTCYKTVAILRDLVRASSNKIIDPIAIVLSIHQPQQEVFELFDKIYMISSGGVPIYHGSPTDCVQYVEKLVGVSMPSLDYNPASFMIELASGEYGQEPIVKLEQQLNINFNNDVRNQPEEPEQNGSLEEYSSKWKSQFQSGEKWLNASNAPLLNNSKIIDLEAVGQANNKSSSSQQDLTLNIDPRIPKASSTNSGQFYHKTAILLERCWISELHDPKQTIVKFLYFLMTPIALSLMMGKTRGGADGCPRYISSFELKDLARNDSELLDKKVQEELILSLENLALYFMTTFSMVTAIIGTMAVTFSTDIRRSMKEFHNGWYSMSCFIVARIISELPLHILLTSMTMVLTFILTGQNANHGMANEYRFLLINGGMVLSSIVSQILGMIIGAIFIGDITTALFVSQGIVLPFVFFSGFVARTKNLTKIIYILSFASYIKHALDIAVVGRYGFNLCPCNSSLITGNDAQLLGVPDKLKSFTDLWVTTNADDYENEIDQSSTDTTNMINSTITDIATTTEVPKPQKDIFQLFAKQVFLYNTRGVDIKSCDDMLPYQMHEVSLADDDMYFAYSALSLYIVIVIMLLFVTVRFVMN